MNDNELKKLWQQQPLRETPIPSPAQLVSTMQKQTTQLRRTLFLRDIAELVACGFVAIIFGYFFFRDEQAPISRLGDLIVIGSSIFIAFKLVYAHRSHPPAPSGATVLESLKRRMAQHNEGNATLQQYRAAWKALDHRFGDDIRFRRELVNALTLCGCETPRDLVEVTRW